MSWPQQGHRSVTGGTACCTLGFGATLRNLHPEGVPHDRMGFLRFLRFLRALLDVTHIIRGALLQSACLLPVVTRGCYRANALQYPRLLSGDAFSVITGYKAVLLPASYPNKLHYTLLFTLYSLTARAYPSGYFIQHVKDRHQPAFLIGGAKVRTRIRMAMEKEAVCYQLLLIVNDCYWLWMIVTGCYPNRHKKASD